jgi:hypothetical protein
MRSLQKMGGAANYCGGRPNLDSRWFTAKESSVPNASRSVWTALSSIWTSARTRPNKLLAQRVAEVCQPPDDSCKRGADDGDAEQRQRDLCPFCGLMKGTDVIRVKEDEPLMLNIGVTG